MIYAAYGSNLNKKQFQKRCPDAKFIATGVLTGYKLSFRGNAPGYAYLNIERTGNKKDKVPVAIFDISEKDEKALDYYEGYPDFYVKETLVVDQKERMTKATVYIMTDGYEKSVPSMKYFNTCLQGYKDYGFKTYGLYYALGKGF